MASLIGATFAACVRCLPLGRINSNIFSGSFPILTNYPKSTLSCPIPLRSVPAAEAMNDLGGADRMSEAAG